ncbi:phytase [Microvirga pudoricolor]|uniref:phytase n=1 Tax=Microvirga pudoricolor TaxID=2778729 RepID=UPI001951B29A|nr:phytase [Microvirga pudoricolor]MBM6595647.1 phytase [Microvirga pudoricolor]
MAFSGNVAALAETPSVAGSGDVADDPTFWINRNDPAASYIIGTSKHPSQGGLYVYDLQGRQVDHYAAGEALNNGDLRYDFDLGGSLIDLYGATNRKTNQIDFFTLDAGGDLQKLGSVPSGISGVYGFSLAKVDDTLYAFVTHRNSGVVNQLEIYDDNGSLASKLVRSFDVGSVAEGVVVDDRTGAVYISQESTGIWRYDVDPETGSARTLVAEVGTSGLRADVEGLAIYEGQDGAGYLVASSQGSDSYSVFDRASNSYLGSFKVAANGGIDAASDTDGVAVTGQNLGDVYEQGMLVVHDSSNSGGATSNFKLVPWSGIAALIGQETPPDSPPPQQPEEPNPEPQTDDPTFQSVNWAGSAGADTAIGNALDNVMDGNFGNDLLKGGAGNDRIDGDYGADTLWGGSGKDVFVFMHSRATNGDVIKDFVQGEDMIDLSGIDADKGRAGNQDYEFIGDAPIARVGQVSFVQDAAENRTYLYGNSTGTTAPEFRLIVEGLHTFTVADFVL